MKTVATIGTLNDVLTYIGQELGLTNIRTESLKRTAQPVAILLGEHDNEGNLITINGESREDFVNKLKGNHCSIDDTEFSKTGVFLPLIDIEFFNVTHSGTVLPKSSLNPGYYLDEVIKKSDSIVLLKNKKIRAYFDENSRALSKIASMVLSVYIMKQKGEELDDLEIENVRERIDEGLKEILRSTLFLDCSFHDFLGGFYKDHPDVKTIYEQFMYDYMMKIADDEILTFSHPTKFADFALTVLASDLVDEKDVQYILKKLVARNERWFCGANDGVPALRIAHNCKIFCEGMKASKEIKYYQSKKLSVEKLKEIVRYNLSALDKKTNGKRISWDKLECLANSFAFVSYWSEGRNGFTQDDVFDYYVNPVAKMMIEHKDEYDDLLDRIVKCINSNTSKKKLPKTIQPLLLLLKNIINLNEISREVMLATFPNGIALDIEVEKEDSVEFELRSAVISPIMDKRRTLQFLPATIMYINLAPDEEFKKTKHDVALAFLSVVKSYYSSNGTTTTPLINEAINTLIREVPGDREGKVIKKQRWKDFMDELLTVVAEENKVLTYRKLYGFIRHVGLQSITNTDKYNNDKTYKKVMFDESLKQR